MLNTVFLTLFLLLPSITLLITRPRYWALFFCLCLFPPLVIWLIFVLELIVLLHGLVV